MNLSTHKAKESRYILICYQGSIWVPSTLVIVIVGQPIAKLMSFASQWIYVLTHIYIYQNQYTLNEFSPSSVSRYCLAHRPKSILDSTNSFIAIPNL